MVKHLAILLVGALSAPAFDILVYNTTSAPVANQALFPLRSIGAVPVFPANYGVLVFSDTPATSNWNGALPNHPLAWCKVSGGTVLAMSTAESNSIVAAQVAADLVSRQAGETAAKLEATNTVELGYYSDGRIARAIADTTRSEINILRAEVTFLRMELNKAKVNITSWRAEAAFSTNGFAPRTAIQMRNAIIGEINSQPNTAP